MSPSWQTRAVSASDVVAVVRSGQNLFVHGACATATPLLDALCERRDLSDVRLYRLHTGGPAPFATTGRESELRSVSLFTGMSLRQAIAEGRADFVPIFLSDIPGLFLSETVKLDVAILQLSLPDASGLCSLGTSCDAAKAAAEKARLIALPSTAAGGKLSRLVVALNAGAGVVTTRGHVHWIVTEYGAVNLHGKTLRERGEALISFAHPDFRAELQCDLANARTFSGAIAA